MIALYREWNERINVVSRKDIDALAEDIVRTFELTRDGKEKKWFRKNSASARR